MGSFSFRWIIRIFLFFLSVAAVLTGEQVKVGAYQNPPKVFMTPDGRTAGIFPEVLEYIGERNDWEIEYVYGTWQECLDRLERGEIDLMVDVADSEERRELFDFSSEAVLVNWGTAYSRDDRTIESLLDLNNQTVAVMKGSVHTEGEGGIKNLLSQLGVKCRFVEVDDYRQVLLLVDSKQADAGIVNRLFGELYSDEFNVSPTPIIFNPRELLFATARGSERGDRFLEDIDRVMAGEKADSVFQKILNYYLGGGSGEWRHQDGALLPGIELSPEQRRWIEEHRTVRFGVDLEFAPFEFLSKEGEYRGIAADFLNLVGQRTGLNFELVTCSSWAETMEAVKEKKIDLLPGIGYGEERRQFLSYSQPYQEFSRVIVTSLESDITGLADLKNRRVGVQAASSHQAFIEDSTDLEPISYKTYEECLLALSRGELDGVIGNLAVTTHVIQNLALTNIKMAAYAEPEPQALAFGVRSDWPELVSIIDQVLDSITMKQRNAILAKWLPLPRPASNEIDLTREEREWLLMHPRIRVGWDPSWAPVEFADSDGEPRGISMEYLDALQDMLGIELVPGEPDDWQSTYGRLINRELDMSTCLNVTPERLEHLTFTDSYISSPVVIFGREEFPYIRDLSEIRGFKVAVVENYATDEWISRDYPDWDLIRTSTIADGFSLLKRGRADLFIGSVLAGNYYLSRHQFRDVKIVGETPYTYKLRMAVRKDWPQFAGILHKALASLPEVDRTAFYRKWVWVKYEQAVDYKLLGKVALGGLVIILIFLYWNRRLAVEIRARKESQAALEVREKALRSSYGELKELEELKRNLTNMIVHDIRSPLMSIIGALDLIDEDGEAIEGISLVDMARSEARRVTEMAQGLLDISRLEEGRMPLNRVETDIRSVIENAIRAMDIQAGVAGVHLALSGDNSILNIDRDIMERVFINLLGNAVLASSEGMTVDVCIGNDKSTVIIEVRDRGDGIPEDFREELFEKFTTARFGNKGKASVGLGLAFCKLAVDAHGGEISVFSEEGKGSTFSVHLPGIRSAV